MHARQPVTKWYYIGPMFRAERPQRGRYRQFHQAGCELYGDEGPLSDAEVLDMLYLTMTRLGLCQIKVLVNSLGSKEARLDYRQKLLDYFTPLSNQLSEHAQERLSDNPLRILDSKDPRDQEASTGAPLLLDSLTVEDREHFNGLKAALDRLGTPYEVEPRLVRGLDYYSRTCFEIVAESGEIGSQSAIVGGGRYDAMLEGLGGPPTPAIGFAIGLERILLAASNEEEERSPLCFVAPLGEQAKLECLALSQKLRLKGFRVELDGRGGSLKSMLRRANSMGARVCIVMGKDEVEGGHAQLKDLLEHTQETLPLSEVVKVTSQLLSTPTSPAGAL
jgi:histidyl-tRNA synthetase